MLFVNEKSNVRSAKDLRFIQLWPSAALQIWIVIHLYYQQSACALTGDVCLAFTTKSLYIYLQHVIGQ